jgi:hypothetical protein
MIPGFYLFHMASGLLFAVNLASGIPATFLNEAILNGAVAVIVSVTIAFGLIAPKCASSTSGKAVQRSVRSAFDSSTPSASGRRY